MKTRAGVLALCVALSGCARGPERSQDLDADEARLRETVDASEQGPSQWSPLVTVPLAPVLLVVDTTIKLGEAAVRFVRSIFGGGAEEGPPIPERVERQAENIPNN